MMNYQQKLLQKMLKEAILNITDHLQGVKAKRKESKAMVKIIDLSAPWISKLIPVEDLKLIAIAYAEKHPKKVKEYLLAIKDVIGTSV